MPQKSIANIILEEVQSIPDEEETFNGFTPKGDNSFLILFTSAPRRSWGVIHSAFWKFFAILRDGEMARSGVIRCERFKTVRAVLKIAEHYGMETRIFMAEELEEDVKG